MTVPTASSDNKPRVERLKDVMVFEIRCIAVLQLKYTGWLMLISRADAKIGSSLFLICFSLPVWPELSSPYVLIDL